MKKVLARVRKSFDQLSRRSSDETKDASDASASEKSVSGAVGAPEETLVSSEHQIKTATSAIAAEKAKITGTTPDCTGISGNPKSPEDSDETGGSRLGTKKKRKKSDGAGDEAKSKLIQDDYNPAWFRVPDRKELFKTRPKLMEIRNQEERNKLLAVKLDLIKIRFEFKPKILQSRVEIEGVSKEVGIKKESTKVIEDCESEEERLGKLKKSELMAEIEEFVSYSPDWYSVENARKVVEAMAVNIFRSFPKTLQDEDGIDTDEDEAFQDPAWVHLAYAYETILRILGSQDYEVKQLKKIFTRGFVVRIVSMFSTPDFRERDYVKNIVHRIYGKFMSFRAMIRKLFRDEFISYSFDNSLHPGITEILEIVGKLLDVSCHLNGFLGSIVNGYAIPLKDEHKSFLYECLMPLHKSPVLQTFKPQLCYCVTQYIEKDPLLSHRILTQLVSFWPIIKPAKIVIYLNEVEEILHSVDAANIQGAIPWVFQAVSRCIASQHFQVWRLNGHCLMIYRYAKELCFSGTMTESSNSV
jgi:hypothetical protein